MTEAIFGLVGVLIGSGISWLQTWWTNRQTTGKSARYLAIRLVCILDKYLEDCAEVVNDDGLSYGQRQADGCLQAQVQAPGPPVFPDDIDWKSIDSDLMYKILSFPSEVESADRLIKATLTFAGPPDYEEWFIERRFYYCRFGLFAYELSDKLCREYQIKKKSYNDWNPVVDLAHDLEAIALKRQKRMQSNMDFVNKHLGPQ